MNIRMCRALSAVAAFVILAAVGCTDTTVEPKSTVAETNIFNDPNSYRAFIAKIYAGLAVTGQQGPAGNQDITTTDEGFYQYLRVLWTSQELATDEAIIGWNDVGLPEVNKQTWGETNGFVVAWYYRIFYQIGLANEYLRQTSDDKLDARGVTPAWRAQIKNYRAEARFLRALSYWHGIDAFGNIPLITEADPLGSTPPQQSTRAEIFTFVVTELNELKADLPPRSPSTYGRATASAADMLLAKLYLNSAVYTGTARWSEARVAAEAVIAGNFSLAGNYRHNFMADNHTSPEIIFAVPQDGLKTQTWGGMTFMVHAALGGDMNAGNYGVDFPWGGTRLKPEAYRLYSAGDGRTSYFFTTNQTVEITNIGDFRTGIAAPKYTNKTSTGENGSNATHPDTDFPMFRLADAYLIYAEAVIRGGGGSREQALTYVNAIRQRAYGDTSGNITDAQLTLDFILAERGRELLWEAHRRTDLVRFGKFSGGEYIWAWKGGVQAGTSTGVHLDLYPLPQNELVANPNLEQNPGY
jgi:hypothetical protein